MMKVVHVKCSSASAFEDPQEREQAMLGWTHYLLEPLAGDLRANATELSVVSITHRTGVLIPALG